MDQQQQHQQQRRGEASPPHPPHPPPHVSYPIAHQQQQENYPAHPPVPYQQFEYNFPPAFPDQLLPPPDESTSTTNNELFSASEHTNLLGFLDQFEWQFDPLLPSGIPTFTSPDAHPPLPPRTTTTPSSSLANAMPHPHHPPSPPTQQNHQMSGPVYMSAPLQHHQQYNAPVGYSGTAHSNPQNHHAPSYETNTLNYSDPIKPDIQNDDDGVEGSTSHINEQNGGGNGSNPGRPQKPVLSTPEKRVRHILSEQRRRNTIRDGYAALTTMLVPHPAAASRPPPPKSSRGKGKGTRGRTRGKGKSGVLFRAVEYVKWLQETVEDLNAEVEKLEAATSNLNHTANSGWHHTQ